MMTVASGKIGQFLSGFALIAVVCLPTTAAELPFSKPEKTRLEVGTAGSGTTSLPLFVALDGGYFTKRGLTVRSIKSAPRSRCRELFPARLIFIRAAPRQSRQISPVPILSTSLPRWIAIRSFCLAKRASHLSRVCAGSRSRRRSRAHLVRSPLG